MATTSLPAVDHPNADRWNAARSRQKLLRTPRGRHLSRHRRPFWGPLAAILDFAGSEQVPPSPLGLYCLLMFMIGAGFKKIELLEWLLG